MISARKIFKLASANTKFHTFCYIITSALRGARDVNQYAHQRQNFTDENLAIQVMMVVNSRN